MRSISVRVDNCLRVRSDLIGQELVEQILDELTIPNAAKKKAKKVDRWGWWDLPDNFFLGEIDGSDLIMPRGYALQFKLLLREEGIKVKWIDRRKWSRGKRFKWAKQFTPREHQTPAVAAMRRHQQGIYEAPTGSGKSLTVINLIHDLSPERSIILVDKLELLNQWHTDVEDWLGIECGVIGSGKWKEERVTIATVQTLSKALKSGRIDEDWFKQWDLVNVDECHHVTAVTIQELVGLFTARIRGGNSATPDRQDDKFEIALNILGEVFHSDDEEELRKRGVLVKPKVSVITTSFDFEYWGDQKVDADEECDVPGCSLIGRPHKHQNNYQDLKYALVGDRARNARVCSTVFSQCGDKHHHLIVSDEIRQLTEIETILTGLSKAKTGTRMPPIFVLTGRMGKAKRKQMVKDIKSANQAIILSTVAKEGLDIPAIDRIYLPFPASNGKKIQQWIGRGTRTSEGKDETIVFDFLDILVGVLKKQFKNRADKCYTKLGLEIERD